MGNSPDFDVEGHCGTYYDDIINRSARNLSLDPATIDKLRESRNAMCNSTTLGVTAGMALVDGLADSTGFLTWMPSRGKCVKYRQEGQSCIPTQNSTGPFKGTFIRRASVVGRAIAGGGSLDRPLACAPGLVCTGPDYEVLPSTCVKARPANLCFAGPWWDSSRCPRTHVEWYDTQGGMNRSWAIESLRSSLLLYPGEVDSASSCTFWNSPHVAAAVESNVKHSPIADALATAGHWAARPNLVWSLIHFVMHNQPAPMPRSAVEASQALATHLS